jgi:peptidylprolyl isomerase
MSLIPKDTLKMICYCLFGVLLLSLSTVMASAIGDEGEGEGEWVELKKGLRYIDLVVGEGDEVKPGRRANVHYTGYLPDGTKFQSSRDSGKSFIFEVGAGQVVRGWDLGVRGMKEGGKRKLFVPSKLAYGGRGVKAGGQWVIPPDSDLTFVVEVLTVN